MYFRFCFRLPQMQKIFDEGTRNQVLMHDLFCLGVDISIRDNDGITGTSYDGDKMNHA